MILTRAHAKLTLLLILTHPANPLKSWSGCGEVEKDAYENVLIRYTNNDGKTAILNAVDNDLSQVNVLHNSNVMSVKVNDPVVIDKLRGNPNIDAIEPNYEICVLDIPQNPRVWTPDAITSNARNLAEDTPYGINMVQAPQIWNITGSKDIKICVVDTGYDLGHPDLPTNADGVDGWEPAYNGKWNEDGHGHGTHCAGTIGAIGDNDEGVVGVMKDKSKFKFYIGKALNDKGTGKLSNVLSAVNKCVDEGAKIISMSLGGGSSDQISYDTYKNAYDKDVLIIAAAGNRGNSDHSYPASYPHVMSVAAVDSSENHAYFSQWNDQVEISGPGLGIRSTWIKGKYKSASGTSMAAPHVAGVAALVWSHFPTCTNNQIRNVLIITAKDKGDKGCDGKYGYGIVQAKDAYDLLVEKGCEAGGPKDSQLSDGGIGGCSQDPTDANLPTVAPTEFVCPESQKAFELNLLTDSYGYETSWEIRDERSSVINNKDIEFESNKQYNFFECLNSAGCYTFTIYDSYGDGICCGHGIGRYSIKYNEEQVFTDSTGDFKKSETSQVFGSCGVSQNQSSSPSTIPSVGPSNSPSSKPSSVLSVSKMPSAEPSIAPSTTPTSLPSSKPSANRTASPSSKPSDYNKVYIKKLMDKSKHKKKGKTWFSKVKIVVKHKNRGIMKGIFVAGVFGNLEKLFFCRTNSKGICNIKGPKLKSAQNEINFVVTQLGDGESTYNLDYSDMTHITLNKPPSKK
eukprot:CAMPEP_0194423034 /NCGR_PEP_ID=MMETSP0176-20130528/22356_1 /TAXON_ID=216777 /ORGANISM="Proboscia alata, Strain PI-D3" /LENGTH=737 /DNA_ID=CAMNT_0039232103 /DNA_START=53 /DNA_END=2266 /DNA_ORIENTATION=+